MSNSYFQFKQFRVEQDACAMKVSTDACIQGAWTSIEDSIKNVLDIGCGTGLLSLMLAQRSGHIYIDAVELDNGAAKQAQQNIAASSWANRIKVYEDDIKNFESGRQYDLIICNPPFFNNSLLGSADARNKARHTLSLSYADLVNVLNKYLTSDGCASVLLPATESVLWEEMLLDNGLYVKKKLLVQPRQESSPNRVITVCTRQPQTIQNETLVIYNSDNSYTKAFAHLLHPYYLNL